MHRSTLEPWLGREQPGDFVVLAVDRNHSDLLVTQLLNEAGAGSFVFDQDVRARILFLLLDHLSLEIGKIKALADQVEADNSCRLEQLIEILIPRPCGCSDCGCSVIKSTTLTTRMRMSGTCDRN